MAKGRVKIPEELRGLLASQWETVITEACLGRDDTLIARWVLMDRMPQIDVAIELDIDRSTVSYRLPKIIEQVCRTAQKLNMK